PVLPYWCLTLTVSDPVLRGPGWTVSFAAHLPAGTVPARVARVDRGAAEVITADGPRRVRFGARVRRAAADDPVALPCVGDWVALAPLPAADVAGGLELAKVLPRRTAIVRGGVARPSRAGPSLARGPVRRLHRGGAPRQRRRGLRRRAGPPRPRSGEPRPDRTAARPRLGERRHPGRAHHQGRPRRRRAARAAGGGGADRAR